MFLALSVPRYYFFTVGMLYFAWGLVKSVILGLLDRLPGGDPLLDEDEYEAEVRALDYRELGPRGHAPQHMGHDPIVEEEA